MKKWKNHQHYIVHRTTIVDLLVPEISLGEKLANDRRHSLVVLNECIEDE
jgi:hypothetical protein